MKNVLAKNVYVNQAEWCTPVVPALRKASLGCIASPCLKKKKSAPSSIIHDRQKAEPTAMFTV
jgi:hypothetical protein